MTSFCLSGCGKSASNNKANHCDDDISEAADKNDFQKCIEIGEACQREYFDNREAVNWYKFKTAACHSQWGSLSAKKGDVQTAIEKLKLGVTGTGFPPFVLGVKGTAPRSTWFDHENVPSNVVGIPIPIDGTLGVVAVDNENSVSYDVEIYEHSGNLQSQTLLHTVTVATKSKVDEGLSAAVTKGKQLAAKVKDTSANAPKNPKITLVLKNA